MEGQALGKNGNFDYKYILNNQLLRTASEGSLTSQKEFGRVTVRVIESCLKIFDALLTPYCDNDYLEKKREIKEYLNNLNKYDKRQREKYYDKLIEHFAEVVCLMDRNNLLLEKNTNLVFESPKRKK